MTEDQGPMTLQPPVLVPGRKSKYNNYHRDLLEYDAMQYNREGLLHMQTITRIMHVISALSLSFAVAKFRC